MLSRLGSKNELGTAGTVLGFFLATRVGTRRVPSLSLWLASRRDVPRQKSRDHVVALSSDTPAVDAFFALVAAPVNFGGRFEFFFLDVNDHSPTSEY